MSIVRLILDFFDSFFKSSSPDAQKKQALRKITQELKAVQPIIYKNDMVQPNVAELFRILYENTGLISDILSETICSTDLKKSIKFEYYLMLTGFSDADQERFEKLTFENRKAEVKKSVNLMARAFENQKHTLEYLLKELNTPVFQKIEEVIAGLKQLNDICMFNYATVLRNFDPDFKGMDPKYKPNFKSAVVDNFANSFKDFYYITAKFSVKNSMLKAILALKQIYLGKQLSESEISSISEKLKKINSVLRKYLTPEILKKFICISKNDPDFIPQTASYTAKSRQNFSTYAHEMFVADETRIKNEIKAEIISSELNDLFGEELVELEGYNEANNRLLQEETAFSYEWITPLRIIKTFIKKFYTESVQNFLDSVVIEGFFNNPAYKTNFSSTVYSCSDCIAQIDKFEKSFMREGANDQVITNSYIVDAHKDADFLKKLASTVENVNEQAYNLVQNITNDFYNLYVMLGELFLDAKKAKSDVIMNIKMLVNSSGNREKAYLLEKQYDSWKRFLEIMKNYAIIGDIEKKS